MIKRKNSSISNSFHKLVGDPVEYDLRVYETLLSQINALDLTKVTNEKIKKQSVDLFRKAKNGDPLEKLLVEAYSLVRETARRTIRLRPFDVQILAGIALHQGKLVEMPTGEGKTLAAVFPAYLNALVRKGVHVLTFNDYLARRDAEWMGPIYKFLGLSVGHVQDGMKKSDRQRAYACDITYATAKEAGFDFLRDHLCYEKESLVQRNYHFALVDEADSILIDEARVPLVIAGSVGKYTEDPGHLAAMVKNIKPGIDFETDDGKRNIFLTDVGLNHFEKILNCGNLHTSDNLDLLTRINLALQAEFLLHRDVDYIVRNGKIEVVDEFTGRVVEDRHWPDGLQSALETKEKLQMGTSGTVLGQITLQHFLSLYPKLSGMTATAQSAAEELHTFYKLKTVVIPPNRPNIRKDFPDEVFTHKSAKTKALIDEIRKWHTKERPILVGTASVEESEELAAELKEAGIDCQVLNAKNDEREAGIIAQAGVPGAVTISTNMAGRGTDIKLGGDAEQEREKVVALGGLYVIGTNRYESLRIDIQLRGRAGRQGDPGSSRFFVSLEDNLMVKFGLKNLFPKKFQDLKQEEPLSNPLVNREVARSQRVVEGQNFDVRKTLWKYSSLVEEERKFVQSQRQNILKDEVSFNFLKEKAGKHYSKIRALIGQEKLDKLEKQITILQMDRFWADHLAMITDVRESIHLVNVGGESPINEFHRILTDAFREREQKINSRIVKSFESLKITKDGVDLDSDELKGPSSTWTYLINDNQFGAWMEMLKGGNIGFAAGAAAWYGPIFILWGIIHRLMKKKKKEEF
ncbi:MAG: accessory Sec system translocase SecA2 [Candidatus Aminicenantes bacterium]|nr:accessory Sec system translocase SecA2 [Candidatus Aminicenantes bacterium]